MGQSWESRPWRHYTVSYITYGGKRIETDIVARDMGEAITRMGGPMLPGMTVAPGPYAERAPE